MNFLNRSAIFLGCALLLEPVIGNTQALPPQGKHISIPTGAVATVEWEIATGEQCSDLFGLPTHQNNESAFKNLALKKNVQVEAYLVGHGWPGALCTGDGFLCHTSETTLNAYNDGDWGGSARAVMNGYSRLTIAACSAGRFAEGSDFLKNLANITSMPVRAPTGNIWCINGEMIMDDGVEWMEVKPGEKPGSNRGPTYTAPEQSRYNLEVDGQILELAAEAVTVLRFNYIVRPSFAQLAVIDSDASALVKLADFSSPSHRAGTLLAAQTGSLVLKVKISPQRTVVKSFVLYADDILQDQDDKSLYYRVDTRLHDKLQQLRLALRTGTPTR